MNNDRAKVGYIFIATNGNDFQKDFLKDFPKDCTKHLTERQYVIINNILLSATITIPEIARKTGVSERTIKTDIADLQAKGILTREGGRKDGRWVITNKNDHKE